MWVCGCKSFSRGYCLGYTLDTDIDITFKFYNVDWRVVQLYAPFLSNELHGSMKSRSDVWILDVWFFNTFVLPEPHLHSLPLSASLSSQ